jgi:hypothetical protein
VPEAAAEAALEEAAYYQTIEEFFVSRRGDPLFLSNADWLLIRKWRRSGLPLRIALRGIADALDGHAHSWGRKRKVGSLAYCAAEVDAARERWQRALSFDDEAETSVSAALTAFADALEAATGLGGRGTAAARSAATELRAWTVPAAGGPPRLEALTRRLGATEKALLEALRADADPAALAAIDREIEADLAPYRGRMPERVLDQIRDEAWARRLLARHGIPRLSLFHL